MRRGGRRSGGGTSGETNSTNRDLLVGRSAESRSPGQPSDAATRRPHQESHPSDTREQTLQQIFEVVRKLDARIEALSAAPQPGREATDNLARTAAEISKSVEGARGAMAAIRRAVERGGDPAQLQTALNQVRAALHEEREHLRKDVREALQQAEAAAEELRKMITQSGEVANRLGYVSRTVTEQGEKWETTRFVSGLLIAIALLISLFLGSCVQRAYTVWGFGDEYHEWHDYVETHYAPLLALCVSRARIDEEFRLCAVEIKPHAGITVPLRSRFRWIDNTGDLKAFDPQSVR